ncbi:MAG: metallophosphoesterase [Caldilineaceae bacterium]|nr:metallophosphoesterase [Caldilineaceae bacterium]
MKIVHFSDLHLDSPFAWAGAARGAARQRRQALRDTLVRIVDLTRKVNADALFCGGDLYEQEYFSPDTAEFLKDTFAGLAPIPVYIAPGNHDWYGPQSLYAQVAWSENVHLFREAALREVELEDGLRLWGAAHLGPATAVNFLERFRVEQSGIHIALFHGSERSWFGEQDTGKKLHAAFNANEVEAAGFAHAFLGHYHRPKDAKFHTYPGNPDPLAFGEDGERGAVVATIGPDGRVASERHRIAVTEAHDEELNVTGMATEQQILDLLEAKVSSLSGFIRLTVRGEIAPTIDIQESDLRDRLNNFEAARIVFGDLRRTYNLESISQERTVRGQFVRDVLGSDLAEKEKQRVVVTGLRALEGRTDLEVI